MKSTFLLFFFAFMSVAVFAQNGIGFQGIARDPQGNAIPNQTISVKFTIGTFTETQNISTDNFGVFSATIGSENTTAFNNIIFANLNDNLKVEVDGTTIYDDKFNTVPFAKAAENGVPAGTIVPFAGQKVKFRLVGFIAMEVHMQVQECMGHCIPQSAIPGETMVEISGFLI